MKRIIGLFLSSAVVLCFCFAEEPNESIDEYVQAAEDVGSLSPEDTHPGAHQVTPEDLQRVREEQQGAIRTLDEDFRQLKDDVRRLQKEIAELRVKIVSKSTQSAPVERPSASDTAEATGLKKGKASRSVPVDNLDEEAESVLKLLEQSAPADENDSPQKKDKNLEAVRKISTKHAIETAPSLPAGNSQAQYNEAFSLYNKGAHKQAERAFDHFITTYPNDPLVTKAMYWKAESCLAVGKHKEAKVLFVNAYKKEPKGQKAPDCLLKLGETLAVQGKKDDACTAWKKLESDFPNMSKEMKSRLTKARKQHGCG